MMGGIMGLAAGYLIWLVAWALTQKKPPGKGGSN